MGQVDPIPTEIDDAITLFDGAEIATQKELDTGDFWIEVEDGHASLQAWRLNEWRLFTSTRNSSGKIDWTFSRLPDDA